MFYQANKKVFKIEGRNFVLVKEKNRRVWVDGDNKYHLRPLISNKKNWTIKEIDVQRALDREDYHHRSNDPEKGQARKRGKAKYDAERHKNIKKIVHDALQKSRYGERRAI